MSKLSRDLIDLLYKHYLFNHILLHIEAAHAEPFIFEFEKCSNWLIFSNAHYSVFTYADIHLFIHV